MWHSELWVGDMVGIGHSLASMVLEVISNLNDSVIFHSPGCSGFRGTSRWPQKNNFLKVTSLWVRGHTPDETEAIFIL